MSVRIAEVAVNVPLDGTFHYIVPDGMDIRPLQRVAVNFAGRETVGFVLSVVPEPDVRDKISGFKMKTVNQIVDHEPIIDERTVALARWMSDHYIHPFGETLFAITPSAKKGKEYRHPYHYTGRLSPLNDEQQAACDAVAGCLRDPSKRSSGKFLIHGVTGSGKTEVYKHLVRKTLDLGLSAIILVPEIALTPQNLERFYQSFGDEVTLYHSRLTGSEKLSEWLKALRGRSHAVIGPRSAVFSPVRNLGLVIIDEEHEPSYKSGNAPRYHARQVAYRRAQTEGAVLVLGSATPQLETYYYARQGDFRLLELKSRYGGTELPTVETLDLRETAGEKNLVSGTLLKCLIRTLDKKKQALLFLNRRGFSPVLICKDCGHVFGCPDCNVSLTFHRADRSLQCHHCGHAESVPKKCPECGSENISELGSGTEKLEQVIRSQFPNAAVDRMDLDTTRKRTGYLDILERVRSGKTDILVGTQMLAKGHDIAGIHLVGVVLPDITLNIPDFRSAERTFVLLTQVIGRAGRRGDRGEALIQTYLPDHYAITSSAAQDFALFYNTEIGKRKAFRYPPYVRIGRMVIRGEDKQKLDEFCARLKKFIPENPPAPGTEVLGPVSCPMEKLKKNYRSHIIIKSGDIREIRRILRLLREEFRSHPLSKHLFIEIDIDPVSMV